MGKGLRRSSGHFILPYGIRDDTAYVNDPASTKPEKIRGSWIRLQKKVKYYFLCERPKKDTPHDWAKDARAWAKKENLLDGTRPQDPVTREEIALVLRRFKSK